MLIVVDENVSYGVVEILRTGGHYVISISELHERGMSDEDVYALILREHAILITRNYHFTNSVQSPAEKTEGIIYIRHGRHNIFASISLLFNP